MQQWRRWIAYWPCVTEALTACKLVQVQVYNSYPAVAPHVIVTAIKAAYHPSFKAGKVDRPELSEQEIVAVQKEVSAVSTVGDAASGWINHRYHCTGWAMIWTADSIQS